MPTPEQRDYYARRAADVREMAANATDADIRATLESMATSYDHLVEEADRIALMRRQVPDA